MVRDDLQACLQAYQFAELLLGRFLEKPEKEREQAVAAAVDLRDEVQPRYEAAMGAGSYGAGELEALRDARAHVEQRLEDARSQLEHARSK